ncbi:MAG: hypothetical protein ABIH46_13885, partial [Chloroflexota bacterium]
HIKPKRARVNHGICPECLHPIQPGDQDGMGGGTRSQRMRPHHWACLYDLDTIHRNMEARLKRGERP